MSDDLMTFFRNRTLDRGRSWRMKVVRPDGDAWLAIYSTQYLDKPAYLTEFPRDKLGGYPHYMARLAKAIGDGGGGLLVESSELDGQRYVDIRKIRPAEAGAYRPPSAVFHFDYGGPEECPFPGDRLSLVVARSAHVILPVDEEAELKFRAFREHFAAWFPADYESLMMETLRNPSLGLRVDRLERMLEEIQSASPANRAPPPRGLARLLPWLRPARNPQDSK